MYYRIKKHISDIPPSINDDDSWKDADKADIACFRPEGTNHKPSTSVMLKYSKQAIYGLFTVKDRFVRCVNHGNGTPVYNDSCVEFFVKPQQDKGYFNFEFNCGGSILSSYILNPQRVPGGFKEFSELTPKDYSMITVHHSMPQIVEPEITENTDWRLFFIIPFELMKRYTKMPEPVSNNIWQANFNKCGDKTSHPHWATWAPVDKLNFHMPQCFGKIIFD